jgi:hypothetical protein
MLSYMINSGNSNDFSGAGGCVLNVIYYIWAIESIFKSQITF